ncbi:MAG: radical SAM protein [Candidatus Scalindua sediminis]|nr:radical SAM protein [Candidatus Scalindua sediminis]
MSSFSEKLRQSIIDLQHKRLLIAKISGSIQEEDLKVPPNCKGYGRIRHFKQKSGSNWPSDPLPMDPACKALKLPKTDIMQAQVFQIAACDWRCWYCFVPYVLLSAKTESAAWLSSKELIDLYLKELNPPSVIDLSGGSPNLVPEWILWTIQELISRKLENKVYLWSDDNLSNDFFLKYLTEDQREIITSYKNYGHVCCFKGFSKESFSFNTKADPILFKEQFYFMKRLIPLGIDLYAYTTFTTPTKRNIYDDMKRFIDQLQELHENLPLRTIPLEIIEFTPVIRRLNEIRRKALKNQWIAVEIWSKELEERFSSKERSKDITEIVLGK